MNGSELVEVSPLQNTVYFPAFYNKMHKTIFDNA